MKCYFQNQKGWQISRCNYDGSQLQVVYIGLQSKPVHFQVDPFNGCVITKLLLSQFANQANHSKHFHSQQKYSIKFTDIYFGH